MANLNLSWTPGNTGNSTGQRILRTARKVQSAPNLTTTFTPANDLSPTQTTAVASGLLTNIVYRFKVQNLCAVGGPTDSSIKEYIKFECLPITFLVLKTGELYCQVTLGQYQVIDGVTVGSENVSDIENVEFSLYDSTNTTLLSGPVLGTLSTGYSPRASAIFNAIATGTTYVVRYTLFATVNGVQVRSDNAAFLNTYCSASTVIPGSLDIAAFTVVNNYHSGSATTIEDVINFNNYYTITTGSVPVAAASTASGTHVTVRGAIVVVVNETEGNFSAMLSLFVNDVFIESVPITPNITGPYTFTYQSFLGGDAIKIVLDEAL